MSDTASIDRPQLNPAKFSARVAQTPCLEPTLTVSGEAIGDYRISQIWLARARQQPGRHTLVLDVTASATAAQAPHALIERVFALHYTEAPAGHRCDHVVIANGTQRLTIMVEDAW